MHEFSLCEDIVATLLKEYDAFAAKKGNAGKITRVRLVLGVLHQIVPESLLLAYEALTAGTPFEGSDLELRFIPLSISCSSCRWEGEIKSPLFICPQCGGRDVSTRSGNELYIEDMEVETDG